MTRQRAEFNNSHSRLKNKRFYLILFLYLRVHVPLPCCRTGLGYGMDKYLLQGLNYMNADESESFFFLFFFWGGWGRGKGGWLEGTF